MEQVHSSWRLLVSDGWKGTSRRSSCRPAEQFGSSGMCFRTCNLKTREWNRPILHAEQFRSSGMCLYTCDLKTSQRDWMGWVHSSWRLLELMDGRDQQDNIPHAEQPRSDIT
ncbi:hypothetical protein C0J52_22345 [Blattella germanica]|nr:hypothetical protein C0J52_22345 [Blattella germanica]PSN30017.1 hypothetical protein C0J52_22345 [Blattella germanica]